jgi:hypothetical protein
VLASGCKPELLCGDGTVTAARCCISQLARCTMADDTAHLTLGRPHSAGDATKPLLAHFLEGLLRRLLLEAAGRDAIEAAADCLLALILAAPDTFRSIGAACLRHKCSAVYLILCGSAHAAEW